MRFLRLWGWAVPVLVLLACFSPCAALFAADAEQAAEVEGRLRESVGYLASDALEGRGVGTDGLEKAAAYLSEQFRGMGLKTDVIEGAAFQPFTITIRSEVGPNNKLTLVGPPAADKPDVKREIALTLNESFTPLSSGGSGAVDLPVVFVGYGITFKKRGPAPAGGAAPAGNEAPAEEVVYDDYAGLDVKGKAVIILRKEPQQDDPNSVFDGNKPTIHATFQKKLQLAYQQGAAAVILVQDDKGVKARLAARQKALVESLEKLAAEKTKLAGLAAPTAEQLEESRKAIDALAAQVRSLCDQLRSDFDPLIGFHESGGETGGRTFPVLSVRRGVVDQLLKAAVNKDLATLEREIDAETKPRSVDLSAWRLAGEVNVVRVDAQVKNVVAVLDGAGALAEETVVVGAHYDHVGRGGPGSGAMDPNINEIHNGADDNASGTATLVEVARRLAGLAAHLPTRRRLVFIAFSAEERGLFGSQHYVEHPLFPLDKTVAMLNLDMVGRLNAENKLIIQGVDTSPQFGLSILNANQKTAFKIALEPGGFGPSDHASFYGKKIPVMHFFTGTHPDYHRPSDDSDKLNLDGMRRVAEMVTSVAMDVVGSDERPQYVEVAPKAQRRGGDRPYFGSVPSFGEKVEGYALGGVAKGSPAEKAGLKSGDVIVKLGETKIGNLDDFDGALRQYKAGDKVPVTVKRGADNVTVDVTLDPPR